MKVKTKAFKAAFPATVPVMMGYLFIGIAFGVLMQTKGFHFGWSILMGILVYAGAMQFVTVGFLAGGIDIVSMIFITLMVNMRHIFYGLAMLDKFKGMGKKKPYMIYALTDETFSLLCAPKVPDQVDRNWYYFFIALLDQLYWVIGSGIGGIVGSLFTFNTTGIDFAMTALFVAIFMDQWQQNKNHISSITGVAASLVCLLVFGSSNFILPAMAVIVLVLVIGKKKIETGEDQSW